MLWRKRTADTPVGSAVWFLTEGINKLLLSKPWGSLSPRIGGLRQGSTILTARGERYRSAITPVREDIHFIGWVGAEGT